MKNDHVLFQLNWCKEKLMAKKLRLRKHNLMKLLSVETSFVNTINIHNIRGKVIRIFNYIYTYIFNFIKSYFLKPKFLSYFFFAPTYLT